MAQARFSIGIDLGTTNSALAFVPLEGEAPPEVFAVLQWDSLTSVAEAPTLPSFLYLPEDAVAAQLPGQRAGQGEWIVGRLARRRSAETPDRVVQSAKSWLAHHGADRSASFLPWGSDEIAEDKKISPIRASALILNALRGAWNDRFAGSGNDLQFDAQEITVTVPASFDAVAQRLTIEAAAEAGFPTGVRLLEEPQAAFYDWLERHDPAHVLGETCASGETPHVLVIDIGGGTSDFSLFALELKAGSAAAIRRIAVSEHILLGGDNIDLALAHLVESQVSGEEDRLSGSQWSHLVARCRDLKEQVLANSDGQDTVYPISIPARGSSLIAGSVSARLTRAAIDDVVYDGFFPVCTANDRPRKLQAALKEWGLPFAADSRITRHLAEFLSDRPRVDAVLFNGGTLYPQTLRKRLCDAIASWQIGVSPLVLDNPAPDLAVARGAARFGKLVARKSERIAAGAARAIFIAAHRKPAAAAGDGGSEPTLICILPRGADPEETFEVADLGLELRINRPVRFQTYSSTRHGRCAAGELVPWSANDFHPLPPLETVARGTVTGRGDADRSLPVSLSARINELGLLRVACVSTDPARPQSWPLEFNLRAQELATSIAAGEAEATPNVDPRALAEAADAIRSAFGRSYQRDKLTAARVFKTLDSTLHLPRADWNWVLIRSLWPALEECMHCRATSPDHEEAWLIIAGFLLRPGFGAPLDDLRIDGLWRLRENGLAFAGKRSRLQEHILWRRVAGGLARERQERILAPDLAKIRQAGNLMPELVYLAGSLERLGHETKAELIRAFTSVAVDLGRRKQHCAPYLTALGLLLNRSPLYAGPEAVVSPELVADTYEALSALDWADPNLTDIQALFLRAARVVDNRAIDLPKSLRSRIARRLEKADVPPLRTARLREFLPIERSERLGLFGEALPPGLLLAGEER
jgi:Molecular chaperone